ncbi:MAG TPA: helix-hairpin-helix domain-containing protein [Methylotenera sp.]|nr:helix-hairpin-helix domain-containing protein [Methylotenera sp.]HPH04313.1 helix-hairpin-helix domain-containing protein [Methylotenera sp.]HPM99867.1 helix-hairpin-helix domain-containing protein [Methylotenera sp.]
MKKWLLILITSLIISISPNVYAVVELNTATQQELETLHGIGPVKAEAIIEYREANGGFKSIEELGNVKGIGSATLESIRKDISVWNPYWKKY